MKTVETTIDRGGNNDANSGAIVEKAVLNFD